MKIGAFLEQRGDFGRKNLGNMVEKQEFCKLILELWGVSRVYYGVERVEPNEGLLMMKR